MENADLAKRVIRLAPWLAIGSLLILILVVLIGSLIAHSDVNDIFARIGQVGDVTGGVTAPILNFLGMLIVYYSLREQLRANNMQNEAIQRELKKSAGEAILKSTEGMIGSAAELVDDGMTELRDVVQKIHQFDNRVNNGDYGLNKKEIIAMQHDSLISADEHLRPIAVLVSSIYDRINNEAFPEEQKLYILHLFNAKCMRFLPQHHIVQKELDLTYAPNYRQIFNVNVAFTNLYQSTYQVLLTTPIKATI